MNGVALLLNSIDTAWFPFTQKRTTADFFKLISTGDDVGNNIGRYLLDYWYLLFIWAGLLFIGVLLYRKTKNNASSFSLFKVPTRIIIFLVLTFCTLVFGRGGLQYKPLSIQSAVTAAGPASIPLVLNTPFTIIKSFRDDPLPSTVYFTDKKADELFDPHQRLSTTAEFTHQNVVEIILESFSYEYIGALTNGEGYTPFLDSLMKSSMVFTHAFANGKRSIEGIPAVVASIPPLMDEPFITSTWNANKINSLGSLLEPKGYSSAFFHGGTNGTMGFDNFSKLAGYKNYFGKNEYDGPASDYDGHWGIFDEPFYAFMIRKINRMPLPFVATVFTLSSHHPYIIPDQYKGRFPKGKLPIFESIGYADHALQIFFKNASKQSWFANTIFVITADHTGEAENISYKNRYGMYRIPVVIYQPNHPAQIKNDFVFQQTDLLPTILQLLHYNGDYSAYGQSAFAAVPFRWAVSYANSSWQLITSRYTLQFDGNVTTGLFDISNDPLLHNDIKNQLTDTLHRYEPVLKSIIQQYRQELLHNTILAH